MFNFKRNQIIITVLVFMIAIAAYLNTKQAPLGEMNLVDRTTFGESEVAEEEDFFAGYDEQLVSNEGANKEEGNGAEVLSEDVTSVGLLPDEAESGILNGQSIEAIITKKESETATVESASQTVSSSVEESYFAEEKLLREQSRASQLEELKQYVELENLDADSKAKAAASLLAIQERIEKESSAEALLRAKGFKEVYVRISENAVDVVVSKAELTETDIAQIEEIVNRKTGYSVGKINITPLNGIVKEN